MNVTRRIKTRHDRCLPAAQPFSAMVGEAATDWPAGLFRVRGLSNATELELLVDVRSHPYAHARGPDRHRHRAGDALHSPCRSRLQVNRDHHARRQLRLAAALPARQRRGDVLPCCLHSHVPQPLLRIIQGAVRAGLDPGRHHLSANGGRGLHGLRAGLGPDELLGRDRHNKSVFGHSRRRRHHRHLAVGGYAVGNPTLNRFSRFTTCCRF